MKFESLTRKQAVLRQLRQEIQSGELGPGDPVIEVELASRLEVSVTPVREAVAELVSEGLVEGEPNKRKRVAALTQRDAIELTDYQGILLVAALRRTTGRVTAQERSELAQSLHLFAAALRSGDIENARKSFESFAGQCAALADHQVLTAQLHLAINRSVYRLGLYPLRDLVDVWANGADAAGQAVEHTGVTAGADCLDALFSNVVTRLFAERALDTPVPHPSTIKEVR